MIDWDEYARHHCGRFDEFQSRYHMSEEAFDNLVNILRPDLEVNYHMSRLSTGGELPIGPELIVGSSFVCLYRTVPMSFL